MSPHCFDSTITQKIIGRYSVRVVFKLIIVIVFALCLVLTIYGLFEQNVSMFGIKHWKITGPHVQVFDEIIWKNKSSKTMLLWTPLWGNFVLFADKIKDNLMPCRYKCTVTIDKQELNSSDTIVFHWMDLFFWVKEPLYRSRDQIWLLYGLETPTKTNIFSSFLRPWRFKFNWTMSYRKDSTVFAPYGSYRNKSHLENKNLKKSKRVNFAESKNKFILAITSNCVDDARRYKLIEELKTYINIDVYGKCGNLKCPKYDKKCIPLFAKYKFVLAFENSNCRDYVSEKFWKALEQNSIPIVNWKNAQKSYRDNAPPNSYINIYDFPNLETFATYIKHVDHNNTLYNSYFDWKKKYSITVSVFHKFCDLCKTLHHPRKAQTIIDPATWIDDDVCQRWSFPNLFRRHWDRWMFELGIK